MDPNQIYDLEKRLFQSGYLNQEDIKHFAEIFYARTLKARDRARLEILVRAAVQRFEADEDEGRKEEFRQLLRSYTRFYVFIAQVVRLEDTSLEKLYSYSSWLLCLLPRRERPADIEITDDMLRLRAFRLELKEESNASLTSGDGTELAPILEFGAKPYSEDEQRELSEIVKAFNERHGTTFTEDDFIRYESIYRETLDEDMAAMLLNNAPDIVKGTFSDAFFKCIIETFQQDNEMHDIVLNDTEVRDKLIRFFFNRALREVQSNAV